MTLAAKPVVNDFHALFSGAPAGVDLPRECTYLVRNSLPVPYALKQQAMRSLRDWVIKARALFGADLPMPTIAFDLTGRTAGYADYVRYHIRLNVTLLQENPEYFFTRNIPHELAHLITRRLHPAPKRIKPHGPEWLAVMQRLGLEPRRTHSLDTTNARAITQSQDGRFSCACGPNSLGATKRNRWLKGTTYICNTCKEPLVGNAEALAEKAAYVPPAPKRTRRRRRT